MSHRCFIVFMVSPIFGDLHTAEHETRSRTVAPKSSYQKPVTHPTFGAESYHLQAQVRKTEAAATWRLTGLESTSWMLNSCKDMGCLDGQGIMLYISSNSAVYR